ncbi:MAG: hypothetical protein P8X46_08090 [Nitrospirales bacterium]
MNLSLQGMRQGVIRIGGFALVGCFLVACGGPPNWVEEGSGVLNKENSKSIYGVGSVIGIKNEPLAWETAENRARAELAKTFRTYTAYLMRDYAASTSAGNFTKSTEEQNVERAVKTFSAVTLNGVRPVDRYKDDEDENKPTYYVLVKMSFEEMKDVLQQAQELDAEVREFVRKNAEKAFKKLEEEEAKRPGGL